MTTTTTTTTELAPLSAATGDYSIDATHSWIGFAVRHAGISLVRGSFPAFEGTGRLDGDDVPKTHLHLVVQAGSIATNNTDREAHLRSPEFFDVENFPTIEFVSTSVTRVADPASLRLVGDLTIKGITRSVTADFEYTGVTTDPFGLERVGLHGTATVSRSDWGLVWNVLLDSGAVLVGDRIELTFEVSAVKTVVA